jgi:hypothetical protein
MTKSDIIQLTLEIASRMLENNDISLTTFNLLQERIPNPYIKLISDFYYLKIFMPGNTHDSVMLDVNSEIVSTLLKLEYGVQHQFLYTLALYGFLPLLVFTVPL